MAWAVVVKLLEHSCSFTSSSTVLFIPDVAYFLWVWVGVEVKAGQPLKVSPGEEKLIHLSQLM
ncbi:hypothetical protein CFP56_019145 [Quercus suber]|uniref:Uncharacterized protein n=1 Tax=Quercus suber TaxID=58331 RepID=A0AAW0M0J2_QUESU